MTECPSYRISKFSIVQGIGSLRGSRLTAVQIGSGPQGFKALFAL